MKALSDTVNIPNHPRLLKSWILKENILLSLSQTSMVPHCILNTYLYPPRQGDSHPASKPLYRTQRQLQKHTHTCGQNVENNWLLGSQPQLIHLQLRILQLRFREYLRRSSRQIVSAIRPERLLQDYMF